eukprot:12885996-Prorocentrum_lima.AAC.1
MEDPGHRVSDFMARTVLFLDQVTHPGLIAPSGMRVSGLNHSPEAPDPAGTTTTSVNPASLILAGV